MINTFNLNNIKILCPSVFSISWLFILKLNELLNQKLELGEKGISSIIVQGIKYMIVENTEERKIGTNITGKGHLIICPVPVGGNGALVCYINPQAGPRDCLFTAQEYALKLGNLV